MFDQLLANPGAMAYLFGSMGQAISPKGTWGERLGASAASMGGQMQQANALKGLLGGGQLQAAPGTQIGDLGSNPLISRSGADVMDASGQTSEVGGMGYVPPSSVQSAPAAGGGGMGGLPLAQGMGMDPRLMSAFSMLSQGWGRQGFNVPPGLFSPVNALGADLPNALKTAATVAHTQDELSGAKDMRNLMLKEIPLQQRLDRQEVMADKRNVFMLEKQRLDNIARDERQDKSIRAMAERQSAQIGATLAGIDKRMARERWGTPFAGVDEEGNPAMYRPNSQGGVEKIDGVTPPTTSHDRLTVSGLNAMLAADTKLLETMNSNDPKRVETIDRLRTTRETLESMLKNRPGTPPPKAAPAAAVAPPSTPTQFKSGQVYEDGTGRWRVKSVAPDGKPEWEKVQ